MGQSTDDEQAEREYNEHSGSEGQGGPSKSRKKKTTATATRKSAKDLEKRHRLQASKDSAAKLAKEYPWARLLDSQIDNVWKVECTLCPKNSRGDLCKIRCER